MTDDSRRGRTTQRHARRAKRLAPALGCLGLLALAPACAPFEDGTYAVADTITKAGTVVRAPWGGNRPAQPGDSMTIERVLNAAVPADRLQSEPGDVWPGPLPPRATLANPDAALRGVPEYEPAGPRAVPSDPSATPAPRPPRPPSGRVGSSSPPPDPLLQPELPRGTAALPPPAPLPERPPARTDGRVIQTPGGPVVTTGGTDRVQSFTQPGVGGTGTAVNQGNSTILLSPDGRVQTVPNAAR